MALQPQGGNLGIGTTNPLSLLTLQGQIDNTETNYDSTTVGTYSQLKISNYRNANSALKLGYVYYPGNYEYGRIQTANNVGGTPLAINPDGGNVGIGTTTPYSRLEVWGPDQATHERFHGRQQRFDDRVRRLRQRQRHARR